MPGSANCRPQVCTRHRHSAQKAGNAHYDGLTRFHPKPVAKLAGRQRDGFSADLANLQGYYQTNAVLEERGHQSWMNTACISANSIPNFVPHARFIMIFGATIHCQSSKSSV